MATEEEKKKYWCDQIKTMAGPCLITFAIPLMIPGVTLTLVAFGNDNAFPKYGALHIIGILILGLAVIFLMTGCFLRFYWRPFITPDLEMHLSPRGSARSMQSNRIPKRQERSNSPYTPPETNQNTGSLIYDRGKLDNIPNRSGDNKMTASKSESETEGTGSESERKSLTGNEHRKFDILASPRCRNMVPAHTDSNDQTEPGESGTDVYKGSESYEALQEFRKRKKKGRKRSKERVPKHETENNQVEDDTLYESNEILEKPKVVVEGAKKKRKKDKSPGNLRQDDKVLHDNQMDKSEAADQTKKKKRKKKKEKPLQSTSNEENKYDNGHPLRDNLNEGEDSDQSAISIGSADSVLAQYTSRSRKEHEDS